MERRRTQPTLMDGYISERGDPKLRAKLERLDRAVPWDRLAEPLALTRGHWGVENRLHYVRDTTFGEDACRVRSGHAPQVLAAMRNLSIGLLERTGWKNKAAALRRHAAKPHEALRLIRGSPEN